MAAFRWDQLVYRQEASQIIPRYLDRIGVLDSSAEKLLSAQALDNDYPAALVKGFKLSRAVSIRSYNSADLVQSNIL